MEIDVNQCQTKRISMFTTNKIWFMGIDVEVLTNFVNMLLSCFGFIVLGSF